MPDTPVPAPLVILVVVTLTARVASVVAALAGFGVREAVPILTVLQVIGNGARVACNRRQLVWQVVGWFSLGAVPAAVLGGVRFATAPTPFLQRLLGAFLLAAVAYRHTEVGQRVRVTLRGFAGLGAVAGFLSALVGTVGALAAPYFLSYGLVKGAYIGQGLFIISDHQRG